MEEGERKKGGEKGERRRGRREVKKIPKVFYIEFTYDIIHTI